MHVSVDYVACKWRCAPFVVFVLNKSSVPYVYLWPSPKSRLQEEHLSTVVFLAFPVAAARTWNCLPQYILSTSFQNMTEDLLDLTSHWLSHGCKVPALWLYFGHFNRSTYTVSQKTSHIWLAITFDTCEWILISLAETLPIKQAMKKHFTMPNAKIAFSIKCCINALPEFNKLLISSIFLTHDSYSRCCMTP